MNARGLRLEVVSAFTDWDFLDTTTSLDGALLFVHLLQAGLFQPRTEGICDACDRRRAILM